MLPDDERLTRRRDFAAVYARKRSWAGPLVVLYVWRRQNADANITHLLETRRFGFSVSKKVGKAHDRNLVKRRLREICRLHGTEWRSGFDAVMVARSSSASAGYTDLEAAVCQLMQRAGLMLPLAAAATAQPGE